MRGLGVDQHHRLAADLNLQVTPNWQGGHARSARKLVAQLLCRQLRCGVLSGDNQRSRHLPIAVGVVDVGMEFTTTTRSGCVPSTNSATSESKGDVLVSKTKVDRLREKIDGIASAAFQQRHVLARGNCLKRQDLGGKTPPQARKKAESTEL